MFVQGKSHMHILEDQLLQLDRLGLDGRFDARVLNLGDLNALNILRESVICNLQNPDYYRLEAEAPEFLISHLNSLAGIAVGVFGAEQLVAYATLSFKSPILDDLISAISLPYDVKTSAAFFSSAMVIHEARGYGLHHYLIDIRIALCEKIGIRHRFATISPMNWMSWGHFTAHNMPCIALVERPGGFFRFLVYAEAGVMQFPEEASAVSVPLSDIDALATKFLEGLRIWRYRMCDDNVYAVFAPLRSDL